MGRESTDRSTDGRALAAVATQFFVNGAVFASFVPRLPEVRDRIGVTVGVLGALLSVSGLLGLVGSAAASRAIRRFGTRRVIIVAGLAPVIALPLIGVARSPAVLILGLGVMFGFDVLVDIAMNMQGSWLSGRRHAPVMNRLHGLWSLGTVAGGLISAWMASLGVPLARHLTGTAFVLAVLLAYVATGLLRFDEHPEPDQAVKRRVRFAPSALLLFGVAGAFAVAVEVTSSDWAAFRMTDDFGASAGLAGLAFVAFTVGMTIGRLGGDWALVRLGPDRLLLTAVATAAIGLAGAAFVGVQALALAAYGLAGVGTATFFPRLYDDAARIAGPAGAGLAALTSGTRISALIVPAAVGAMAATSLSVGTATAIVTLPSVAGLLAAVRIAEHSKRFASRAAPPSSAR